MRAINQANKTRVWLVLTFGEDRQYAGNAGYDDEPGKWYSYDSYVANHRQISEGDGVILCDRVRALGIARITEIEDKPSTRVLQRCPVCKGTRIKKRRTKQPPYRCHDGHEFEEPVTENASCTKFIAHFGETFMPFAEQFGRDLLRQGCPRYSDQLAMQEFELSRIERGLRDSFPEAAVLIARLTSDEYLLAEVGDVIPSELEGYEPTGWDDRESILRQIRARRGQQSFRDSLRVRYGDQCMISGSRILHVLEAAHICPYRGVSDNHAENGLLLRADLHTLFDLDLIGIEPSSLTIYFHPALDWGDYSNLHERVLLCSASRGPSPEALKLRWKKFRKRAAK